MYKFPKTLLNLRNLINNPSSGKKLAIILVFLSIASGIATYITITRSSENLNHEIDPEIIISLMLLNLALILGLASVITLKVIGIWKKKSKGSSGSRLQKRIIIMFCLVSIVPTIIVASFSTLFFNFGIQSWFNKRVGSALQESVVVAEAYLAEHKEMIQGDIIAIASDIQRQHSIIGQDPKKLNEVLNTQAGIRGLSEAIIFQPRKIIARTPLSFSLIFDAEELPLESFNRANVGEVVTITSDTDDKVRALIKLNDYINTYLFIGRFVDQKIISHTETVRGSANEYKKLQNDISGLQIKFSFVFIGVAILLLLSAIWFGLIFVSELINPINMLVIATEKIKAGDLTARVKEGFEDDEIGTLSKAFNDMAWQLQKQRNQLIDVNKQIDARRRFIENVLGGVSAGIISLSTDKTVNIFNKSATSLLSANPDKIHSSSYKDFFPEIEEMLEDIDKNPEKPVQREITISRKEKKSTFLVRMSAEVNDKKVDSYIITFDDITEIKAAERSAAWSDVARRIAHEIKNPLTPIHLSAERLRKKYLTEISSDKDSFEKYINTIIRHVRDIGRMVEEFAQFARMPAPVFIKQDLCELIRDSVFSRKSATQEIDYQVMLPEHPIYINCDPGQISQVIENVLKNSAESIEQKNQGAKEGVIKISLNHGNNKSVQISDNGTGFPADLIDRLTEPYITTRDKGTGLGLAIVKKIMDDHHGKLFLKNTDIGASVTLVFP